jgi:hypothetical protein
MQRTIHIIYRHIPIRAEKNSRDPNKSRPEWFSYQVCFHNLMQTIRSDPRGHQVKVLVLFDGTMDEFLQDFIATYYANADLKLGVQFVQGGSNGATFLIALDMLRKSDIPDSDIIYFLENDYLHQHGWVSKALELFDSQHKVDIVSLYDHRDKYDFAMYDDLRSKLYYTATHHWRTVPSTCGTFLLEKAEMLRDYDIWTANLIDYMLFPTLQNDRGRLLLTPVPGLATHCMAGYLSPVVDWQALALQSDNKVSP